MERKYFFLLTLLLTAICLGLLIYCNEKMESAPSRRPIVQASAAALSSRTNIQEGVE